MKSKRIEKILMNFFMFLLVFIIILSGSMLLVKNNMKSTDDFTTEEVLEIEEEKRIQYHFLNIPMQEEIIRPVGGGVEVNSINYPAHFLVPVIISMIITIILFYISILIRRYNKDKLL